MRWRIVITACLCLCLANWVVAAEIDDCREKIARGEYAAALVDITAAIEQGVYGESWHQLKAETELTLGKYPEALETLQSALKRYSWSIRLRWVAMQACRLAGQGELSDDFAIEIGKMVQSTPWRYTDAENLIALGWFALDQGADAKDVQDAFFTRAKRNNPVHRAPVLALGTLALQKHDFALAGEIFTFGIEKFPDDAEMHFGYFQAFKGSDREVANASLVRTLELNPAHFEALLAQADRLIDGEKYDAAGQLLATVTSVNPVHAQALAYSAVIAFLEEDEEKAQELRTKALGLWTENPEVDHLIGRKLSQKYRFLEGSQHQQQALKFDPGYLPAKKQLAQDLLRLGDEHGGWLMAEEVYQQDQYDVSIYNLVTLREELEKFTKLEGNNFDIRMDRHEAEVYGDRVLTLLKNAREVLCEKYQQELPETILVEIFPKPADFAVRTFGMPGANGYLGVCFGDVITANSPASQAASPTNWESVLWHEFAHVVTLNKTHNRMPRWLSEGISVYEERQRNPAWGEKMNATYRRMILGEDLTPVSELSNAFLSPPSGMHLQFAYFESSLVVEYLIDEYGFETLLKVLDDLGAGMFINDALERHTVAIAQLDEEFAAHAKSLANAFAPEVDWSEIEIDVAADSELAVNLLLAWSVQHNTNYRGLKTCAQLLLQRDAPLAAIDVLEQAIKLYPYETGSDSPYVTLAELYRQQEMPEKEQSLLQEFVELDPNAATSRQRLIEIETSQEHWERVRDLSLELLAIKPLIPAPHMSLAAAAMKLESPELAVPPLEALLSMNPGDPALLQFQLAQQYLAVGETDRAKRAVLKALEEAPRYREALTFLAELNTSTQVGN